MTLTLYNSLTRKKEKFIPVTPGRVHIYVCGPTVYGHSHIGHAKSYINFDVVIRWFRYLGYTVKYVQNITDVGHLVGDADEGEDKLQKTAREQQVDPMQVAQTFTWSFFDDMDALGVVRPDISPRATGHIIEQIGMIKNLIDQGLAYESNGSVYFDVHRYPEYGKLSGRDVADMEAGARIDIHEDKRHPADFALWKKSDRTHLMQWPSPWGDGYPGWHIECSAMAIKYLGETFDIHGGGLDNIFPHHECEIAQSEAVTGKPFARYWMHNNTLTMRGEKMSKSLGNVLNVKDALKLYSPEVLRFFLLSNHYRSRLDYSEVAVTAAQQGLSRLDNTVTTIEKQMEKSGELDAFVHPFEISKYRDRFERAMNDDFNAPKGIAVLFDLSKEVNQYLSTPEPHHKPFLEQLKQFYDEFGMNVLGILSHDRLSHSGTSDSGEMVEKLVNLHLDIRKELRNIKNWEISDKIRDGLNYIGIQVKDVPGDTAEWTIEKK